jgi:hypothetical protein
MQEGSRIISVAMALVLQHPRRLGPETWGQRLRRAHGLSELGVREAAYAVSLYIPVSRQRLLDLEKLKDPPKNPSRRCVAYLAIVAYGYDPLDLDLDDSCLPPAWNVTDVAAHVRAAALQECGPTSRSSSWSDPSDIPDVRHEAA